uniref:Protein CDV3 n=1 Tax=Schistosoma japonicum TaxID=6182 RepID=C1L720_SCHJA|nr:hypothetical protein [Schistosoma japonicum]
MSLSDFFAKQNKKKSKKKQNPTELMDMLTKGGDLIKSHQEANAQLESKPAIFEEDDEWEIIDDEKEVDLQNIRINILTSTNIDDSSKQSKSKDSGDGDGESVVEKKVWGSKPVETPEESVEPVVQPPPKPNVYVPAPLRPGGSAFGAVAAKPDVASSMVFPALDASVSEPQKKESQSNKDTIDEKSWQQAGIRRANPVTNASPIAVSTTLSPYVPPSLRQSGSPNFKNMSSSHLGDSFKPRDNPPLRSDIDLGFKRFSENPGVWDPAPSSGGWARGNIISRNSSNNPMAVQLPSNTVDTSLHTPSENTNGWSRNVNVKTYKDNVREVPGLAIDLKNRFTAFSET